MEKENDWRWFLDRAIKWAHDSLLVIGLVSVYLLLSGNLSQDISKEMRARYDEQIARNGTVKKNP